VEIVECSRHTIRIPKTPENLEKLWRLGWPEVLECGKKIP
jgi:hypothetical protein